MPLDLHILGQGVYSPRQAARLIHATPQDVLRWTRGSGPSEPLWHAYYQNLDDATELNFLDLIELRVVIGLKNAGVSHQAIRYAIEIAQSKFGISRPLSTQKFSTDGEEILMEAIEQDGELVSLSRKRPGQKVFAKLISQSLRDLEYENGSVVRWRPAKSKLIVIDPNRQFGAPLLDEYGISSETIYRDFQYYNDSLYIARSYELPHKAVIAAIKFEQTLDGINGQSAL